MKIYNFIILISIIVLITLGITFIPTPNMAIASVTYQDKDKVKVIDLATQNEFSGRYGLFKVVDYVDNKIIYILLSKASPAVIAVIDK